MYVQAQQLDLSLMSRITYANAHELNPSGSFCSPSREHFDKDHFLGEVVQQRTITCEAHRFAHPATESQPRLPSKTYQSPRLVLSASYPIKPQHPQAIGTHPRSECLLTNTLQLQHICQTVITM